MQVSDVSATLKADPLGTTSRLRDIASRGSRYYGSAVSLSHLLESPAYGSALSSEALVITTEGDLQWSRMERVPGGFDYSRVDALVQFAANHELAVRGHSLLWPQQLPAWLPGLLRRSNADSLLHRRIETAMRRYAGRIRSWDVLNEVIEPLDGRADGLRRTVWIDSLGPDYIARAFRFAHEVDPHAQLVLNEYLLELDTPAGEARRVAMLRLLRQLTSTGVPINALGIQLHTSPLDQIDEDKVRRFLAEVASLGLSVVVTELDVYDFGLPGDVAWRDAIVAATYQRVLRLFLTNPAVEGVITWGISDRYSWLDRAEKRPDGMPFRGLLLDAGYARKPAWAAVSDEFARVAGGVSPRIKDLPGAPR